MQYFDHEKLYVYQASLELVGLIDDMIKLFPRGRAYLVDQLQRAGSSVTLNIAEGAGEYSSNEKGRFYRIAKRSATECAGILDICLKLKMMEEAQYSKLRELLISIVSMLIKMARSSSDKCEGQGQG